MAKVANISGLIARFERLPAEMQEALLKVSEKNATEFMELAKRICPKERLDLVQSFQMWRGERHGENARWGGYSVSVGDDRAPYPAFVEFGHMQAGGSDNHLAGRGVHVEKEPFFFTARRILQRKFSRRSADDARKTARAICKGP